MAVLRWMTGVTAMMVVIIGGLIAAAMVLTGEVGNGIIAGVVTWGAFEVAKRCS